jgi:hypothetical protein
MTTVVKNTRIADMLEVSRGNFKVLERMTDEFREMVQAPYKGFRASKVQSTKEKASKE